MVVLFAVFVVAVLGAFTAVLYWPSPIRVVARPLETDAPDDRSEGGSKP